MKKIDNIVINKLGYSNLYIIRGENADVLIDTGFICMQKKLKKWLDNYNIKLIILTHSHIDHTWNASYLQKLYNCEIAMSGKDPINNEKMKSYASKKNHILWTKLMNYGMKKIKVKKFRVDKYLKNGDVINKYGLDLEIISLPGHTKGSIGIKYKEYLFCGDALVNRKINKVEIAYQNQNNNLSTLTATKILSLNPKIIFPGHDHYIRNKKMKKSFNRI